MNITIRNSLLALTVVGALSLAACKTTDDTMDAPTPAAEPASEQPPSDTTTAPPVDDTAPPADEAMPTTP